MECLWDCTWQINPYVGRTYLYNDSLQIALTMPKVPVDLRCLDSCTDVRFPVLFDPFTGQPVDCSSSQLGSFFFCYVYFSLFDSYTVFNASYGTFVSKTYFDLAVESCLLAVLEPSFYPAGNCTQLGVNLRIFNPYLPPPHLANSSPKSKLQGPATEEVVAFLGLDGLDIPPKNRHPWLCSLRTPGYRGVHRCGVTLLSGPPRPSIFVSAAHCNYLCKDDATGLLVEICCCRDPQSPFSCSSSSFCGASNSLQLAAPADLKIVCNLLSQEALPQGLGYPEPVVLSILEIRNHPNYIPLTESSQAGGPIDGSDISVYIVDDSNFAAQMDPNGTWPACLPKAESAYLPGNRGILVGWNEPVPTYLERASSLQYYNTQNWIVREALFERQPHCADPVWMRSATYYPAGTVCYTEAAWAGSVQFGISGSGLARPFASATAGQPPRYSWAGLLSFSKGSDYTVLDENIGWTQYSSNPAVFTDGRCYLDWIAAQYGLSLPAGYTAPPSCSVAAGDRAAVNKTTCLSRAIRLNETSPSNVPQQCRFTPSFDRCQLYEYNEGARPVYNLNFYYCINILGQPAVCANDCPGVDPNAVVVGGEVAFLSLAVAATAAVGGPDLLAPALGAAVSLAGLGLGGVAMTSRMPAAAAITAAADTACPAGQCLSQVTRRCCAFVIVSRRRLCPFFC